LPSQILPLRYVVGKLLPEPAVNAQLIVADVALRFHDISTLNGADANVALPKYIPLASALNIELSVPIAIVTQLIEPALTLPNVAVIAAKDDVYILLPSIIVEFQAI